MWRSAGLGGVVGMLGARNVLTSRPQKVQADQRPDVLRRVGEVYRINEQVIDPVSLLANLAAPHAGRLIRAAEQDVDINAHAGKVESLRVHSLTLRPRHIVITAGGGASALLTRLGLQATAPMQRRPLHMVMVRSPEHTPTALPWLNGHCVDRMATRVTITSDTDNTGRSVWQLGGKIAEDGVTLEANALLQHAARELASVLPDLKTAGLEWASYRIDRAELENDGSMPAGATARRTDDVIVAMPTKLVLAPHLAQQVAALLDPPLDPTAHHRLDALAALPRPDVAPPPWERATQWHHIP